MVISSFILLKTVLIITIGVGSQILASIGVQKMRLLSKPIKYHALSGYGLEVVEYVHD